MKNNLTLFISLIILFWGLVIGDWAQSPIPNPHYDKSFYDNMQKLKNFNDNKDN